MSKDENFIKESNEFWRKIIYKEGKIDEEQVLKELSDWYYVLEQIPKIYSEISQGLLSKPMYSSETIIQQLNENYYDKGITQDDLKDMILRCKTFEDLKDEIESYFDIKEELKNDPN